MITSTKKNQINCIYVSGYKFSDQLLAFLQSTSKAVFAVDISKTMPSDTQWHDIAIRLNVSLKSFINTEVIENFKKGASHSEEGWVKILANNPKAFKGAIIMEDERIAHITQYTQLLEFYNVDSAGLKKKFGTEPPLTQRQTDKDSFI